jgi:putative protein kinase ArgK-like GTPase of G3E family
MLDFADLVALNKFDKRGALDALRDVKNTSAIIIFGMRLNDAGFNPSQFNDQE